MSSAIQETRELSKYGKDDFLNNQGREGEEGCRVFVGLELLLGALHPLMMQLSGCCAPSVSRDVANWLVRSTARLGLFLDASST